MSERAEDGSILNRPLFVEDNNGAQHEECVILSQISSPSLPSPWHTATNTTSSSSYCRRCTLQFCPCRHHRFEKVALLIAICLLASILIVTYNYEGFHILSMRNLFRPLLFGTADRGPNTGELPLGMDEAADTTATCLRDSVDSSISILHLNLTRNAVAFTMSLTDNADNIHIVSHGFHWDGDDSKTTKWRPQGVTTHHTELDRRKVFALISWYGRAEEGFANIGGRISFVDISTTTMQNERSASTKTTTSVASTTNSIVDQHYYPYTHVLLVDENYCTLPNIHVGGIEQVNGTLYVADSREGEMKILEFDIGHDLYELVEEVLGFRYVLRQSSSFRSPTKPSFLSYDVDHHQFVVGTFFRCGGKVAGMHTDSIECFDRPENRIEWIPPVDPQSAFDNYDTVDESCTKWHYFSEMQGAASAIVDNVTRVWVSSSYGSQAGSHLHVIDIPPNSTLGCLGAHDVVRVEDATIFR